MSTSNNHQHSEGPVAALRVDCPHCGEALHIVTALPPQPPAAPDQPHLPLVAGFGRMLGILTPTNSSDGEQNGTRLSLQLRTLAQLARHRWQFLSVFVAGAAILCLVLFWSNTPLKLREAATPPVQAAPSSAPISDTTRAAIIDTLTQYNRAETEAAALMSFTPLQPLLAPGSAVAERRAAQLAQRQREKAPHRTMLVRWAVGEVVVTGDTATVITQETWTNQETDAVAPDQATVRVVYTLRWDEAVARWLIVESEQTPL